MRFPVVPLRVRDIREWLRGLAIRSSYCFIFLVAGSIPYLGLNGSLSVLEWQALGCVLHAHCILLILREEVLDEAGAEAGLPHVRIADKDN